MDQNSKSQVIERLKIAQDVLVTVSNNPSVDQLSAAIGFTLMLNKLGKHATAVFSGDIPLVLEFLKPEDTLESNTDSLRDFIISLDKAKADKLRYKVEENVVKIFITPYKTSLSDADLNFSQGDFNVDVVVALGVEERDNIDQAIMAHGRILHDATVIGVMAGSIPMDLGSINWQEPSASSLCEMLVSISEAFGSGLLDNQMATAFLTGIVAETDRFSNEKTTSKVMTMSAQLMAAGANQQLIASELKPAYIEEQRETQGTDMYESNHTEEVPLVKQQSPDEATIPLHPKEGYTGPVYHEHKPNHPIQESDIHIDDQGAFKDSTELASAVEDIQQSSVEANQGAMSEDTPSSNEREQLVDNDQVYEDQESDIVDSKVEVIQDGNDSVVDEYSKFITTPPVSGGTFTASDKDEVLDPAIDPFSVLPSTPSVNAEAESDKSLDEPPQNSNEPKIVKGSAGLNRTSKFDPSVYQKPLGEPVDTLSPLGPNVVNNESLAAIERSVNSFEHPTGNGLDAEAARRAVDQAVNSPDYDPVKPQPIDALNSQPMAGIDDLAPPAVPPPLVPSFSDNDINKKSEHNNDQDSADTQFPPIFK